MTGHAVKAKDGLELTVTSTYDLEGVALDWAVARCLGLDPRINQESHGRIWEGCWISAPEYQRLPGYSKSWSLAGPILDQERIELTAVSDNNGKYWEAWADDVSPYDLVENEHAAPTASGKTPQIAVMRAFVISKVGLTMLIPACLLDQSNENSGVAANTSRPTAGANQAALRKEDEVQALRQQRAALLDLLEQAVSMAELRLEPHLANKGVGGIADYWLQPAKDVIAEIKSGSDKQETVNQSNEIDNKPRKGNKP